MYWHPSECKQPCYDSSRASHNSLSDPEPMMRLQLHNDHSRVSLWVDEYKRTTINKAADHTQHHIQTQHNTTHI